MGLGIVPSGKADDAKWLSVGELLLTKFDDASDPQGHYRRAQSLLWQARSAFRSGDANTFNLVSEEFRTVVRTIGSASQSYPSRIQDRFGSGVQPLETISLRLDADDVGDGCHAASLGQSLAAVLLERRRFVRPRDGCALIVGFSMRVIISGRPPVTNMYESVIYVGSGVAIFGIVFESDLPAKDMF